MYPFQSDIKNTTFYSFLIKTIRCYMSSVMTDDKRVSTWKGLNLGGSHHKKF